MQAQLARRSGAQTVLLATCYMLQAPFYLLLTVAVRSSQSTVALSRLGLSFFHVVIHVELRLLLVRAPSVPLERLRLMLLQMQQPLQLLLEFPLHLHAAEAALVKLAAPADFATLSPCSLCSLCSTSSSCYSCSPCSSISPCPLFVTVFLAALMSRMPFLLLK